MELQMSTNFLHLIEPGLYGTNLGENMYTVEDEYIENYKKAIVDYGIDKINEMLSEDNILFWFGKCKAENGKLNSPRFYNYENDSIEFDLVIPDEAIKSIRNAKYTNGFFEWCKKNYGSHSGFISFFPYYREKFENALKSNDLDLSRAVAMVMMKAFEEKIGEEELLRYQRDFEDDVVEEGNRNGWFIDESEVD